jgi:hypothetical protein
MKFGGLKLGFARYIYQLDIELDVPKDPMIPASWDINMEAMRSFRFFMFIAY